MSCGRCEFGVVLESVRGRVLVRAFRRLVLFGVTLSALGLGPVSVSWGDVNQHAGIVINGAVPGEGFADCGCATGSGTKTDPYVIGPWAITDDNNSAHAAVAVENVTADFTITGISANYTDTNRTDPVIYLSNVNPTDPALVSNVSANGDGTGVEIDSSSNITLSSVSVNKMNGTGLRIIDSNDITSINGKYKATSDGLNPDDHEADGLYAAGSSHLYIGGVAGCPSNGICNTFDYDSGWGIYLGPDKQIPPQQTTNVTIDNATANADDTGGYILDGASYVKLENSTGEAGGPICISQQGEKTASGYKPTGLLGNLVLVNGAHDNTIENDTFSGYETGVGYDIAEAPNPFYNSPCGGSPIPTTSGSVSGANNFVKNSICYTTSFVPPSLPPLPPSYCKS